MKASKYIPYTKTLENTPENIKMLEDNGYEKSPVSKPNGIQKVIRYNTERGVYWFTNSWIATMCDAEYNRANTGTGTILVF